MRSAKAVLPLCLVLVAAPGRAEDTSTDPGVEDKTMPVRAKTLENVAPGNGTLLHYRGEPNDHLPLARPVSNGTLGSSSQWEGTINPSIIVSEPIAPLGPAFVGNSPASEQMMIDFFSRARDISQRSPR